MNARLSVHVNMVCLIYYFILEYIQKYLLVLYIVYYFNFNSSIFPDNSFKKYMQKNSLFFQVSLKLSSGLYIIKLLIDLSAHVKLCD